MTTAIAPDVVPGQLAFDETIVDDVELHRALERRQAAKEIAAERRKEYKQANADAAALIARLDLVDAGGAVRVGRFRIERLERPGRSVAFETDPSTTIRIELVESKEGK